MQSNGSLLGVLLEHEMGHLLGIGSNWMPVQSKEEARSHRKRAAGLVFGSDAWLI